MGKDASEEDRDAMSRLVRRIREITEMAGLRRGRPILVAARLPDSVGYCEAIGLDITRWMDEGLIDILVASGDFRLNPWEVAVDLGHKYGVPVYACLSNSAMRDPEARKIRTSLPCWRGCAMNAWAAGADGIYTFNFFHPGSPLWREIGDPDTLAPLDKVYCTGDSGVQEVSRFLNNGGRFLTRSTVSPANPRRLSPGEPVSIELRVGEDVQAGKGQGLMPEATLCLRTENVPDAAQWSVKLNDTPLSDGAKSEIWIEYSVNPALVKKGVNRLVVTLKQNSPTNAVLQDLLLRVRHREGP